MCKFCDALINKKENMWNTRSAYADENLEDKLNENNNIYATDYTQDHSPFKLTSYEHNGSVMVRVEYREELSKNKSDTIIINPFSETIQLNFCPMCGE